MMTEILNQELEDALIAVNNFIEQAKEKIGRLEAMKLNVVFLKDKNDAPAFIKECDMRTENAKVGLKCWTLCKMLVVARKTDNPSRDLIHKIYDKYMDAMIERMTLVSELVSAGLHPESAYLAICNDCKIDAETFKVICINTLDM